MAACRGGAEGKGRWGGSPHLIEESQSLVGWQLYSSMQGGDVVLLEAQAQKNGCLQVGQVGSNVAAEVGLGQPGQQVQNDVMVH